MTTSPLTKISGALQTVTNSVIIGIMEIMGVSSYLMTKSKHKKKQAKQPDNLHALVALPDDPNLPTVGQSGLHRYLQEISQHALLTGKRLMIWPVNLKRKAIRTRPTDW